MDHSESASDDSTTVAELRRLVAGFVAARRWEKFHTPKNLAMSISIEAAELMEHFQWLGLRESGDRAGDPAAKEEIADELADVLIYAISFANQTGIDVSLAVRRKMARNEKRFPPSAET